MAINKALLERIKKASTIKETEILEDSKFFTQKELVTTDVPMLNVAQSGSFDGGFSAGLTVWAGPSKHFKTSLLLANIKAYLDTYADAVCMFFDSEFGSPQAYFRSFGIDPNRVVHIPITDIEQLKFEIMQQINGLARGDKVFVAIDSIGNLASKKEVEDALEGKSVADMTRAKQLKSLFRMVTPHLTIKNLPMMVVNHTYKTQEMYSKDVVSGGTGVYYSADNIYIIGRQQDKDGDELLGYNFIINVEKSRYVKEKSKIPICVSFDRGISKWSGMLDLALEFGLVTKPKVGWYTRPAIEGDKNWRIKETNCKEFWIPLFKETDFAEQVKNHFTLAQNEMINTEAYAEDEDE
jgi:hypothetical protein